jgi:tRNA threonylcarbamoyladenosine modification (KEOPS) complex  Pcc1 subunit
VSDPGWRARIEVRSQDSVWTMWLEQALAPEAAREVPRARAQISRAPPEALTVAIEARDTGAVRAALNTYLGWIDLAVATLDSARSGRPSSDS